jgi:hydroxyacylglutathione hydrolase
MNIERFPAGPLDTNGYLISENEHCLVVDPSLHSHAVIARIKELSLTIDAILLTHSHFDHYLGIHEIMDEFGELPLYLHDNEKTIISDPEKNGASWLGRTDSYTGESIMYLEGENQVADFNFKAIFTPGHTPGGVSLLFGNDCLTGDTLFNNSVGRSDFDYSSTNDLMNSITEKLFTLPGATVIWPGHGFSSTIALEIANNPYVER